MNLSLLACTAARVIPHTMHASVCCFSVCCWLAWRRNQQTWRRSLQSTWPRQPPARNGGWRSPPARLGLQRWAGRGRTRQGRFGWVGCAVLRVGAGYSVGRQQAGAEAAGERGSGAVAAGRQRLGSRGSRHAMRGPAGKGPLPVCSPNPPSSVSPRRCQDSGS